MKQKTINIIRGLLMALAFLILIKTWSSYNTLWGILILILVGTSFTLSYLKPSKQANHIHL